MGKMVDIEFENTLDNGVNKFLRYTGNVKIDNTLLYETWAKMGLQLLNFAANGSPVNPARPPLLTGLLRGSGSVFIGDKFLGALAPVGGKGSPNKSHSESGGVVTVGYNTKYAARIHENLEPTGTYQLGVGSRQSGDVKGGWLRSHLNSDGSLLMRMQAKLIKKGLDSQGRYKP